jgi:pyruvate/2-oxoacid:ferredoxin oxidoreductase beta subunit
VSAKLADRNHPGTLIQTVKAFLEAKAYPGPSMIIAYAPCIAHGYDLCHGLEQQKAAVQSAYWPLFRYHPEWAAAGRNPFVLDSRTSQIFARRGLQIRRRGKGSETAHRPGGRGGRVHSLHQHDGCSFRV